MGVLVRKWYFCSSECKSPPRDVRKKQRKTIVLAAAEQSGSIETATAILIVDKCSSFYGAIKEVDGMVWVGWQKRFTSYCIGKWIAYLFGRVSYEVVCR